jgi:hypothetical protein
VSPAWKITLSLTLPFFTGGFVIGAFIGRATSVDSGKIATAVNFLALYGRWKLVDSTHGRVTLRAGDRTYGYLTGDSNVSIDYISALDLASQPPPKLSFDKDIDKLVALAVAGPPSAGFLATIIQSAPSTGTAALAQSRRGPLIAVVAAFTVGGVAAGYFLVHRANPDYDNEVFQKALQDVSLWKACEQSWRAVYEEGLKEELARKAAEEAEERAASSLDPVERWRVAATQPFGQNLLPHHHSYVEQAYEIHPEIKAQVLLASQAQPVR